MDNFDLMRTRLKARGGLIQQERMIQDKYKSLQKAILYSYQGAKIRKLNDDKIYGALINPNAVKQDYDDKTISIGYEAECVPGTILEWANTKWLIYLQDLTELAYFHGDMRKCSYQIKWRNKSGIEQSTYLALIGPKEAKIQSGIYVDTSIDSPNYTLNFLVPNNSETNQFFVRYQKFYLQGCNDSDQNPICWRVEAIDSISMPGVLEVSAIEYYANKHEDDLNEGLVGDLIITPIEPDTTSMIIGDVFIKPKKTYVYKYIGEEDGAWFIEQEAQKPLIVSRNGKEISLKWDTNYSGQFDLQYGSEIKTIVIESLF